MAVTISVIPMNQHGTAPAAGETIDRETFERLFEDARPTLRVVAGAECGFDYADDAVQQAAIIAFDKIGDFTPGTNFAAWTSAIVRGAARNTRRREKRLGARRLTLARRDHERRPDDGAAPGAIPNTGIRPGGPVPEVHVPESFDPVLKAALARLGPEQRACILLRTVLDHSYETIAELLAIPATTARSHVHRARTRLLDELSQVLDTGRGA